MFKTEALQFFGGTTRLAEAAGVRPSSVSLWGELVPEKRAMRLQLASNGVLLYDPQVYVLREQAKRNGNGNLIHENQPQGRDSGT